MSNKVNGLWAVNSSSVFMFFDSVNTPSVWRFELKAMPLDEPIGEDVVNDIEVMANTGLSHFIKKSFEPCEGVYRIDDFGDYVPYEDWRKFWSAFPEWCEWVFFLHDNAHSDDYWNFTTEVLGGLTPIEIGEQYDASSDYDIDFVFYTEADDEGHV